jgi:hypothetical protein
MVAVVTLERGEGSAVEARHEGETHGLDVAPARTLEVAAAGPLAACS